MKVAIVGGASLIGRHVVQVLGAAGIETVAISRSSGVDVTTGAGVAEALSGVQRVIDVTNAPNTQQDPATAFFTAAAHHRQQAGARAGIDRLVVLSIVGVDRLAGAYWVAKRQHEHAALSGPVPVLLLRSTQFHEFAGQVLQWGRHGDRSRVQEMLVQPVAVQAVARVLADLVLTQNVAAAVLEIAGPRVESLLDMATRLASRRGDPLDVQGFREGTPDEQAIATGALLPSPHATLTGPTFQEWLDAGEQVPAPAR
jgi:uncharacterized protein YbjT (DUF2867 family)